MAFLILFFRVSVFSLYVAIRSSNTSSAPAADSVVTSPQALRLVFSEGVEASFTQVSLSRDGAPVALNGLATEGADKKTLVVTPAAPLAAGTYKVDWHAVSVDTHKSAGSYSFKVGQ